MADKQFHIKKIFDAVAIALSTSSTSTAISLKDLRAEGFFSFQLTITGDGTAQVTYLVSNDGVNFVTPASASDIVTAHTKTSGTGGIDVYQFYPEFAKEIKIKITETGGANSITATGFLAIQ